MNSIDRKIFFRADGNSKIGLGHIIRCLALVDMLRHDFKCIFVSNQFDVNIKYLIEKSCSLIEVKGKDSEEEISDFLKLLSKNDIVVIDGYNFNSDYQQAIKLKVKKLVVIADKPNEHYYADMIINQGGIERKAYTAEPYTKVLSGFKYILVRNEFLLSAIKSRQVSKVNTVFICMGGADPFNITIKVLKSCIITKFIKTIIVITGTAYPYTDELRLFIANHPSKKIFHKVNIDASQMVKCIGMCGIAISTASSVSLEICCVKAGLICGTVADNQNAILMELANSRCCLSIGSLIDASEVDIRVFLEKLKDPKIVNSIMKEQSEKMDGLSGYRILGEFKHLSEC